MKKKEVISILFILISVITVLSLLTNIFVRKSDYEIWNSFYNLEENSIDVVVLGSSIIGCAVDSYQLSEETGLNVINMGVSGSTYSVRSAYLEEVLKTQDIKLVVVETWRYMYGPEMDIDALAYSIAGMKFSNNKLNTILSVPVRGDKYDKFELLFPFFMSHNRWNDLSEADFAPIDEIRAYYDLWNDGGHLHIEAQPEIMENNGSIIELSATQMEYLDEIIDLAAENGVEILFVNPQNPEFDEEMYGRINAVNAYLESRGVPYIEGNMEEALIKMTDTAVDFCDYHHTSLSGTYKFTKYLSEYINDNYDFEKTFDPEGEKYREYVELKTNELKRIDSAEYYLMVALNDVFDVYVSIDEHEWDDEDAVRMLENFDDYMPNDMMQYFDLDKDCYLRVVVIDKYTEKIVDVFDVSVSGEGYHY